MGKKADKRTNVTRLVGKKGLVEKAIGQFERGVVKVGYEDWSAEAEDGNDIPKGTTVVVTGITGVTLRVKKEDQ